MSQLLQEVVSELQKLPGIGRRTALRLAMHLLRMECDSVDGMTRAIDRFRHDIKHCQRCNNLSDTELCPICQDQERDRSTICVVEQVADLLSIENTHQYRGLYHVLGGVISPIDGVHPSDLEIESLVQRVKQGGVKEVVLALSTTMEGDTTSYYIARKLAGCEVTLTTIARGVSVGDELQYADELTLGKSIVNRVPYKN